MMLTILQLCSAYSTNTDSTALLVTSSTDMDNFFFSNVSISPVSNSGGGETGYAD